MKRYQVFYTFSGDIEVEANSEEEAREIAEDKAFRDAQFNSTLDIGMIHECQERSD